MKSNIVCFKLNLVFLPKNNGIYKKYSKVPNEYIYEGIQRRLYLIFQTKYTKQSYNPLSYCLVSKVVVYSPPVLVMSGCLGM